MRSMKHHVGTAQCSGESCRMCRHPSGRDCKLGCAATLGRVSHRTWPASGAIMSRNDLYQRMGKQEASHLKPSTAKVLAV